MNIRMFYPLFNIVSCIILLFMGWGFTRNDVMITESSFSYTIHPIGVIAWLALLVFCIGFTIYIKIYNKRNPNKKIKLLSVKPPEYLEEDEMYQYATMKATKKVYTFITWALPCILAFLLMPFPYSKFMIFVLIAMLIIIQNLIFFFEMRKFKES
ncbi:hypothetical protein ACIQ34_03610 [Ureibacillus sp. NPDC094379]